MNWKKRHWVWNFLIVITLIICALAFTAHYKNWTRIKEDRLEILSGIYFLELPYSEIDSVRMVAHIPSMERVNGFSAWTREKGIFRDSVNANKRVFVYVDDLARAKMKVVYRDSLALYLNFSDSLETEKMYHFLKEKLENAKIGNP
jgi:hypothetical protein